MNENQILEQLAQLSQKLDEGETHIKTNSWDEVATLFSQAGKIQASIQNHQPPLDTLCARNPGFKKAYTEIKTVLLEKTERIITTIEKWKQEQVEKISDSKNTLNNISKFYSPNQTSYYFDRKE